MSEEKIDSKARTGIWSSIFFKPNRAQRKQMFFYQVWFVALSSQFLWLFFAFFPGSMQGDEGVGLWYFWLALIVRVLTFHFGLVLCLCAVIALFSKRWRLLVCCLPLVLTTLIPILMTFVSSGVARASGTAGVAISSTNLLMINPTTQGIIGELKEFKPQVMVFQEYSPRWHAALSEAFLKDYPHRVYVTRRDSFGAAIYSKLPFQNKKTKILVGEMHVPTFRVELSHNGQQWVLYNIHTLPPRKMGYVVEQRRQFRDLKERFKDEKYPVLLCGDFNWTEHTSFHKGLLDMGFKEGHTEVGVGHGGTWPVLGIGRYIPGIRLDHMYALRGISFLEHCSGYGQGSDHRPIFAKVAIESR
jgi:endonuclease/exonuclease/phosphatase (EEP) superfamily protein YafD